MKLTVNCRSYEVDVQPESVTVGSASFKTSVLRDNGTITVRVGGRPYKVAVKDENTVMVDGRPFTVQVTGNGRNNGHARPQRTASSRTNGVAQPAKAAVTCPEPGSVHAPMPGTVLAVRVHEGEQVCAGSVLLILEAMKMQNEIKAPAAGTVKRILVEAGQTVASGQVLVLVE